MMKKYLRIAVTGGRDYTDSQVVFDALDATRTNVEAVGAKMFLVVGDATGADCLARLWAKELFLNGEIGYQCFAADWDRFGNSAGPRRNRDMLISGIDKLCSFPGGKGTADMIKICRDAGVYVVEYS